MSNLVVIFIAGRRFLHNGLEVLQVFAVALRLAFTLRKNQMRPNTGRATWSAEVFRNWWSAGLVVMTLRACPPNPSMLSKLFANFENLFFGEL